VKNLPNKTAAKSRVVTDGYTMTSRGPGTTMEFALSIVEKLLGKERAFSVAKAMVFEYS
jgi:4-methyl-5(b-hydroxyethyl)-thiazole monophosphate biosynthesis